MLAAPLDLEATALQSLASRYRAEGYEVVVDPHGPDLPEALQPFRPDLLARRGDELVVAEIRRRRPGGRWRDVERLAEVTRTLPHARFDLVVLDDAPDRPEAASRDWTTDEIKRALADVEKLVAEERTAPALLLLYAALEPQFRAIAAAESVFVPGLGIKPLISALTSEGVISRKDYRMLMDGLDARNAIAHGLRPNTVLHGAALRRLLATARRLARGSKVMGPQREPAV